MTTATKKRTKKLTSDIPEDQPAFRHVGLLSAAICVPKAWTNEQAAAWVESENHAGTTGGWQVDEEAEAHRSVCEQRPNCVHLILKV